MTDFSIISVTYSYRSHVCRDIYYYWFITWPFLTRFFELTDFWNKRNLWRTKTKPSWFVWPCQVQLLPSLFNKTDKMKSNKRGVTISFWCSEKNYGTSLTCYSTFITEALTWECLKTLWAKTKPLLKHEHWKYEGRKDTARRNHKIKTGVLTNELKQSEKKNKQATRTII